MAGKTIVTNANMKPIFIKSLQPIESSDSTQDESVPVQIVQEDKDVSISDEGGDIDATSLSIDEERIDFESSDSPHDENIPVQIV